ncbi:chalcone isomerase [Thozetella sp. PMI_491]|nr:chalcone isomerase [Thozetella sp. PMI_491]
MLRQPLVRQVARPARTALRGQRRTFLASRTQQGRGRISENLNINRLSQEAQDYQRNKRVFLLSGAIAGIVSFVYTAYKLKQELSKPAKLDAGKNALASSDAANRKVVVHDEDGRALVPTGNGTVPMFPRTIELPAYTQTASPDSVSLAAVAGAPTEYTLVGLGLRSVSFIGIQVYVVGYYIATADIAAVQNALVKKVNPIATTLVPGERDQLRKALLDPEESEQIWEELLARGIPARSAFRIAPVRDTDFHHLRDGFVRAIQGKASAIQDEGFGEAMKEFRALFNRGSVPKRKEMVLIRDPQGRLVVVYDDGGNKKEGRPAGRQLLGVVEDERISKALWMNYLGGKKIASEPARASIVEGIMEFVERPVGTVAAQVV